MREVVELRVHGVGGATPEMLLGEAGFADVVQVAGEGPSTFQARRRDRRVEGYVWGKLTSSALVQPLWLLLLPFTLVNVAAWMHLPNEDLRLGRRSRWPFKTLRLLIVLVGLGLTLSYVFWFANVLLIRAYRSETLLGWLDPRARMVAAWLFPALGVGLIFWIARRTQGRFEGFPGPIRPVAPPEGERASTKLGRATQAVLTPARKMAEYSTREERLDDEWFWARVRGAQIRLGFHAIASVVALVVLLAWALARAEDPYGLRLAVFPTYTTEAILWALVAVAVVHVVGWRRPFRGTSFRWIGPLGAATTGVGLATAFFHGLTIWALDPPERVNSLGIATGFAAIAWVVGSLGLGVWMAIKAKRERAKSMIEGTPEWVRTHPGDEKARELTGVTPWMLRKVGLGRATSEAGRSSDLVLTLAQVTFLVTALLQLRFGRLEGLAPVATLGNWVAFTGALGVLAFLIRRSFRPDQRRIIGILWEILTFWPRRFHPLAVRPYSERAVPELQHRICHHVEEGRRVILSAHSQGTVIAYAALVQLARARPEITRDVALVTYGSPLRQLYAWAFPAYFREGDLGDLRQHLFDGDRPNSQTAWRNFYRLTDYIGKSVFQDARFEVVVPDPAGLPRLAQVPLDGALDPAWPDTPRTAWMDLARHSHYNKEPALKEWLERLRSEMST